MPRGIPSKILNELEETEIHPVFFCDFEFDTEPLYTWTGLETIKFDGNTYLGTGQVLSAQPVEETKELKATKMDFTLEGISNGTVEDAKSKNYQGRPCRLKMALARQDGKILDFPFILFEGFMDRLKVNMGPQRATVVVTAENRLRLLKEKNERRYTHEDQQFEFPNDDFFEFVNELQEKSIEFGP